MHLAALAVLVVDQGRHFDETPADSGFAEEADLSVFPRGSQFKQQVEKLLLLLQPVVAHHVLRAEAHRHTEGRLRRNAQVQDFPLFGETVLAGAGDGGMIFFFAQL